jgi:hypothetical protein
VGRPALQSTPSRTALDERNGLLEVSPDQPVHPGNDIEGAMTNLIAAGIAYGLFIGFCAAFAPLAWEIMKCL